MKFYIFIAMTSALSLSIGFIYLSSATYSDGITDVCVGKYFERLLEVRKGFQYFDKVISKLTKAGSSNS